MLDVRDKFGATPWWMRIMAKLVLSRLPVAPSTWQRIGLFRHGSMDDESYAVSVFRSHWKRCGRPDLRGATVLELGPGDSIATAVIARASGANVILVDSGDFAVEAVTTYQHLADRLRAEGLHPPDLSAAESRADILESCDARYLTAGLESLRSIESGSVDLAFSQAVLEHIRREEFDSTMQELNRILKPSGHASHRVDLRDHLGGGLDNLRFGRRLWESSLFVRSGFYTNRFAYSEMLASFSRTHEVLDTRITQEWDTLPIKRARLAREFRGRSEPDMLIAGFDVLLGHKSAAERR
jgi:SAM-dependent methyltransferase